jgi:HD-like signal output (HDOD) protein
MGIVHVDNLKHGMVLSEDARDITSRLLLSKGQRINSNHIRIFKIWGISEVTVEGNYGDAETPEPPIDPELIEKTINKTKVVFSHLDLDHPAIRELFKHAVLYRTRHHKILDHDEKLAFDEYDPSESHVIKDVRARIDKSEIKLPEVPSIIFELNEIIAAPLVSASDIAGIVNKSPSLASLLLRIVNSAFYGFPSKIDNISRAVTLIGSKEISGLALGISTMTMFKDIPQQIIDMGSFMRHSLACGIISRILAAHKNVPQTEQLFVSGLLHDIGRLIVYKYFPAQARTLLHTARDKGQPLYRIESGHLGCRHTDIAKHLLKKWKLPFSLEDNIFFHHNPSSAHNPDKATIVHLADLTANGLGLGSSGERFAAGFDEEAWEMLGMRPAILKPVVQQAVHQLGSLETILQE